MCGIAGIINYSNKRSYKNLERMLLAEKHRGPDGKGKNTDSKVQLGMDRLAIVDLAGGMQPLYNEDKTIEVIGNGEIYNYPELQKKLIKKGHKLHSKSDIETVVHLYEDYGEKCLDYLRGMFALALFDKQKKLVYLIRDRMGEKPLYYSDFKDQFIFASELKALQKIVQSNELDLNSLNLYFYYSYVPEPRTPFQNIRKLPAGNLLCFDLSSNSYSVRKYWHPESINVEDDNDPTGTFRDHIEEACTLNLRADVEVGLSLSGGLDSGAIMALSAPKYGRQMKAFTVGYEGAPKSDERQYAEILAEKYHVRHFEYEIKTKEVVENFPQLVYMTDDPIADIAGYAIYSVSKLARENRIKVLLGGIGGDELFWGYRWVRDAVSASIVRNDRNLIFYDRTPLFKMGRNFTCKLFSRYFKKNINSKLPKDIYQYPHLLNKEIDFAQAGLSAIRDIWLVSDPIALGDRLSMASSVELRSPFLDNKLVESAYRSKKNVQAYKLPHKYWLKKVLDGVVPDDLLNMPKKGFTPPTVQWFFGIIGIYGHLLNNGFLIRENIFSPLFLRTAMLAWKTLPIYWQAYYELVLLEVWGREYVWGNTPEEIRNAKE